MPENNRLNRIVLKAEIANFLHDKSCQLALNGGPQAKGSQGAAEEIAVQLLPLFSGQDKKLINDYIDEKIPYLVFEGLIHTNMDGSPITIPDKLAFPTLQELETDIEILKLASQQQIILALLNETTFAYDKENVGNIIRIVANFYGGGTEKLQNEDPDTSSHSGKAIVPHTEDPYYSAIKVVDGHSPSPSTLVLTARWNPLYETTKVISIERALTLLSLEEIIALTTNSFDFRPAKTAGEGKSLGGKQVPILELNKDGKLNMNFNPERFSVNPSASAFIKDTYIKFNHITEKLAFDAVDLQPSRMIVINNKISLHSRDIVKDNRRTLVRIFGYRKGTEYNMVSQDPLIVKS
ncbi:hypothetical protein G3341_02910 [Providencia vermicola]|uniref:hypothetical protein n=1 Tax=Providencia vermicola TaxID=333965 RepID=UPI0013A724BF|nr:hypothetical protein [Providencia vermicola]QIC14719.1 hypothetical protein G3341_02910 [Providencia vermicola]